MISLTEYLDVARKVTLENGGSLVSVFGSATLFVCLFGVVFYLIPIHPRNKLLNTLHNVRQCLVYSTLSCTNRFLANPQRMNVALTRARHTLYVFGHCKTLKVADGIRVQCLFLCIVHAVYWASRD